MASNELIANIIADMIRKLDKMKFTDIACDIAKMREARKILVLRPLVQDTPPLPETAADESFVAEAR